MDYSENDSYGTVYHYLHTWTRLVPGSSFSVFFHPKPEDGAVETAFFVLSWHGGLGEGAGGNVSRRVGISNAQFTESMTDHGMEMLRTAIREIEKERALIKITPPPKRIKSRRDWRWWSSKKR